VHADDRGSALKNANNCLLRGVPGTYTRLSTDWNWKRTVDRPVRSVFTPFFSVRADVADMNISGQPGVSNYINVGQTDIGRVMRPPVSNTAIRSSTCSPGARRPSSRSPS
jgi:hypothetical protein